MSQNFWKCFVFNRFIRPWRYNPTKISQDFAAPHSPYQECEVDHLFITFFSAMPVYLFYKYEQNQK